MDATFEVASRSVVSNFSNHPVHTILRDEEPWFVARDVARALGYPGKRAMLRLIDEEETDTDGDEEIISKNGLVQAAMECRLSTMVAVIRWLNCWSIYEEIPDASGNEPDDEGEEVLNFMEKSDSQLHTIYNLCNLTLARARRWRELARENGWDTPELIWAHDLFVEGERCAKTVIRDFAAEFSAVQSRRPPDLQNPQTCAAIYLRQFMNR